MGWERLIPFAESGRGCGGVGILWRKSLGATVIADIENMFTLGDGVIVSVLGVYLPCLDLGIVEHLIELERVVSSCDEKCPVIVMGDFNAHIGINYNTRSTCSSNTQGVLL